MRKPSEAFQKAQLFANLWEVEYGEVYVLTPSYAMKLAKELEGVPDDMVVSRAKVYFKNDFYGNCRHSFQAFVRNFNSFVPPKQEKVSEKKACHKCGSMLAYVGQLCPSCYPPAPPEKVKEITSLMNHLEEKLRHE